MFQKRCVLPLAKQLLQEVDYEHHPIRLIGLSVSNLDLGNLFHQVLEQFAATLKKDGISWQTLTQEETERRMDAPH